MALRDSLEDLTKNGKAGDWCFLNQDAHLALQFGASPFLDMVILGIAPVHDQHHWAWNGNHQAPTLEPSILVKAVPRFQRGWHGYLRDGQLITLE